MTVDRIPVSVVTGFLGSGKTTLIAALLDQPAMEGTAVVVNEIGAVGIDDAVFAQSLDPGDVVLLVNGCLCCAAGDDLVSTVWALVRRQDRPRRIVIETSGLADPAPALRRLMADPRLRQATRLDALIVTIDAVNGLQNLTDQPVALRQCAVADRRLITKTDLADAARIATLSERLLALNPGAAVEHASHGAIDAARLFGASLYDAGSGRSDLDRWLNLDEYRSRPLLRGNTEIRFSCDAAHDPSVGTWLVEESRPVRWDVLSPKIGEVVARYGERLLRVKGVIRIVGEERPLIVHGVQGLFHSPVRLDRWTRPPATSIVVIGDEGCRPAIDLIAEALADSAVVAPVKIESRQPALPSRLDAMRSSMA